MMAAVQPFISGAISKTVNMPEASTPEEIAQVYVDGWKLGLKAIAVYRDNSKRSQPLNTKKDDGKDAVKADAVAPEVQTVYKPLRRRLPDERACITHKFNVGGHEGYLTIGLYEDGTPGEIFLRMAKEGSTISGLMDSFATAVSPGAPVRRAAEGPGQQVQPSALRAGRASRPTGTSRWRRAWSTTSSGTWPRSSCRRTRRMRLGSSIGS